MEVDRLSGFPKPYWYWAYQGNFESAGTFYFGLQPNGEYGKTALFSVFGAGTQTKTASCKPGADSEKANTGVSCHIPYAWKRNHRYTFKVSLTSHPQDKNTWTGTVTDTTTGITTTIGDISVPDEWKLISPSLIGWAEWYRGGELTCSQRTNFTVGYSNVTGYAANGTAYRAKVGNLAEGTCATYLVNNDHYMATMDAGGAPTYSVQFTPNVSGDALAEDILSDTKDELDLDIQEAKQIVANASKAGIGVVAGLSQTTAEKLKRDLESHGATHVLVIRPL